MKVNALGSKSGLPPETPVYSGGRDQDGNEIPEYQPKTDEKYNERVYTPYIPSNDLIEAVNLAIKLKRPLLLEGEPGCGKTKLSDALAYEFSRKYLKYSTRFWPYYTWDVKSIGRACDGLYRFDTLLRLRDAQMMGSDFKTLEKFDSEESKAIKDRLSNKQKYIDYGPFGEALLNEKEKDYRSILLIDEIDKSDSDFPNDLLSEFDRMGFGVPEAGIEFRRAVYDPIIIITSNRERPLPEPFLRRCLYYYVKFPDDALLRQIIGKRFGDDRLKDQSKLINAALEELKGIRQLLKDRPGSKAPGTSEVLEFLKALLDLPEEQSLDVVKNLASRSPYLGILLKTKSDQDLYRREHGVTDNE